MYRIYPFETSEFLCSCIWSHWIRASPQIFEWRGRIGWQVVNLPPKIPKNRKRHLILAFLLANLGASLPNFFTVADALPPVPNPRSVLTILETSLSRISNLYSYFGKRHWWGLCRSLGRCKTGVRIASGERRAADVGARGDVRRAGAGPRLRREVIVCGVPAWCVLCRGGERWWKTAEELLVFLAWANLVEFLLLCCFFFRACVEGCLKILTKRSRMVSPSGG